MKKTFTIILLFILGLVGCGGSPEKQNGSVVVQRSGIRIVVITHGQAADPFWSVVKNGVDADWFQLFMGSMLLLAVLVNNFFRMKASEARK